MQAIHPWTSIATVERVIEQDGEEAVGAWLTERWSSDYLAAEPAVAHRLVGLLDLAHLKNRAATVLHAVDNDWIDVLSRADSPECGFLPAFWRDAFARARAAGSTRCVSWLLDRKGEYVSGTGGAEGLEL